MGQHRYRIIDIGLEHPNGDLAVSIKYQGKIYGGYIPRNKVLEQELL